MIAFPDVFGGQLFKAKNHAAISGLCGFPEGKTVITQTFIVS
jgi:hypothetical protein